MATNIDGGVTVVDVLESIDGNTTIAAAIAREDPVNWDLVTPEDLLRPCKLSGGRVCLHAEARDGGEWWYRRNERGELDLYIKGLTMGGTVRASPVEVGHDILAVDVEIRPVLVEETPFNGGIE